MPAPATTQRTAAPTTGRRTSSPSTRQAPPGRESSANTTNAVQNDRESQTTFELKLGMLVRRIPLIGENVRVRGNQLEIALENLGLALPGLQFTSLTLNRDRQSNLISSGTLNGNIRVPFVEGTARLSIDAEGNLSGGARGTLTIGLLNNPRLEFMYLDREWQASLTMGLEDLAARLPVPQVTVTQGTASITIKGDQISGALQADLVHDVLGTGSLNLSIASDAIQGGGSFALQIPFLDGLTGQFSITEGELTARLEFRKDLVPVSPVPGLSVTDLTGLIELKEKRLSGQFGLTAEYANLLKLTLGEVGITSQGLRQARGEMQVLAPPLQETKGRFQISRDRTISGELTVPARDIPLPALKSGSVTVRLLESGLVEVSGQGKLQVGPFEGDVAAGYENQQFWLQGAAALTLPGMEPVTGRFDYREGELQGDVEVGARMAGLTGRAMLSYRNQLFSGQGRLEYSLGKFGGWVMVSVDHDGKISGEGEATFRLSDNLQGTIGLTVDPELNVDARGELAFPSEVRLFAPWEYEKTFFRFDEEFPLWGIRVPVVGSLGIVAEIHATAGFRARFGPGTFRNITAKGELSTRPEQEPRLELTGDFHIPAGAEVVLIVGGGIGLSVVVAKISGGINLRGVAGVYGAITLTPTFLYENGDYKLRGEALLEAAAQLRAGIDAYAAVRAGLGWLSKEVWRKDWNLAEWVFDPGWNIGMRASLEYVVGQPFRPEVKLEEVEVDPKKLVKGAIPNSGEPTSAPVRPSQPTTQFRPAQGEVAQVESSAVPPGNVGASSPPTVSPLPRPPVESATGTPQVNTPGGGPTSGSGLRPTIGDIMAPDALSKPPELRTPDETYVVYLFDNLEGFLSARRRKKSTAPDDTQLLSELVERAFGEKSDGWARDRPNRPGQPLPPGKRAKMEEVLGADLSSVRVHSDEPAREMTRQLGAEAATVDQDIYLGASHSIADDALLAHELTHTAQASGDDARQVSHPSDEPEQQAEQVARAVEWDEQLEPIELKERSARISRVTQQAGTGSNATEAGGEGPRTASLKTTFDEDVFRQLIRDFDFSAMPDLKRRLDQLLDKKQITSNAVRKLYDETQDKFLDRGPIRMHFPAYDHLAHYNAAGQKLIHLNMTLLRYGKGDRADEGRQDWFARLIKKYSAPASQTPAADQFSRSQGNVVSRSRDESWERYQDNDEYKGTSEELRKSSFALRDTVQTEITDRAAFQLNQAGFQFLWERGYRYYPGANRGQGAWRRVQNPDPGVERTQEFPEIPMSGEVADYQAHHVIPLWLRATTGSVGGGDVDNNLVPWHQSAHQTNHRAHETMPDDVAALNLLGVNSRDYRDFPEGTPFVIDRFLQNVPHPSNAPPLRLQGDEFINHGSRPAWLPG